MPGERRIYFAPFELDLVNECLWKASEPIKLRPKAFAVLEHLLSRPGKLVTKQNLIGAVWHDAFVGDAVLKVAIRQIREALSDDPKAPRFIETAHRRGYRFIGEIGATRKMPAITERSAVAGIAHQTSSGQDIPDGVVGREDALSRMYGLLEKVKKGERQLLFVTGEAGIGKTTLLDAFAHSITRVLRVRICSGQCLEQYGMSEAYLPVLDAIRQLCREDAQVIDVLRAHAPMWLMQMPSLVTPSDRESFGREMTGATRDRMLREMGDALDAIAAHIPLVLVLEDLHWSDFSTLDLISYVARRRQPSHLMVVATCRVAELIASGHPLKTVKHELLAKRQCEELPLDYLSEGAVAEYLAARLPAHHFPAELTALIHERTEGLPLFMVSTIDYLVSERLIEPHEGGWRMTAPIDTVKVGVPDSVRRLIETQIDRLDARDQRLLEAASVAGAEFAAATVAAALEEELGGVEARCEDLSRRHQFIKECGVQILPSGQPVGRHGFVHAVYRHVLYERVSPSRRIQLHRRIAQRSEEWYGDRASEIAAELAMHFERARDHQQAVHYLHLASVNATQRAAYREAIVLSRRGLELVRTLPDTAERAQQELRLQLSLGVPLITTEGYAAPEVGSLYVTARALCGRLATTPEISQVLWGLWTFHALRAELSTAFEISQEILSLAEGGAYPGVEMRGHWTMEITRTHQGAFRVALEHFDKALSLYDHRSPDKAFLDALNPGVAVRGFAGWSLWFLGQPDRALVRIQEAVTLARELSEPHGLAHALVFAAVLHQLRRERPLAQEHADEAIALSSEHGLALYEAMARIIRGWALIGRGNDNEAARQIREGLTAWESTGAQLMRPHFLALLAEAQEPASRDGSGLRLLDEALAIAESTGERYFEAELYRLKGERRLQGARSTSGVDAAQECFDQAIAIARRQEALSLELRAAMSLARVHRDRGRHVLARDLIVPICERFDEALDTPDLREARALLDLHPKP